MAKIRITAKDKREYQKLKQSANRKISDRKKKYGVDLSPMVDQRPLESFRTRKEFNEWKEKVEWFNSRYNTATQFKKNQHGLVKSVKEINYETRERNRAIRIAKEINRKLDKKPVYYQGKKISTVGKERKKVKRSKYGVTVPKPFDFDKIGSLSDWDYEQRRNRMKGNYNNYRKGNEKLQANFIKAAYQTFGHYADELVQRIQDIESDVFFDIYMQFNEFTIDEFYPKPDDTEEILGRISQLNSYLDRYFSGEKPPSMFN